jgi:hypothetical protein
MNRRQFLPGLAAAAVVVGFDPFSRRWLTKAEADDPFDDVPRLDGQLLLDASSRAAVSTDKGNIVHQTPAAVLLPGSVEDIRRMIRFCGRQGIQVSARGQAHTTFGQSLSPGLLIENGTLNTIHSIGPDGADVDAGVRWRDLVTAAVGQGLTPPIITGYTKLSVGGTLSVGGVSGLLDHGAQVDTVQELEVVTGAGEIHRCSEQQHADLFEVCLAGLGQCAVITRVRLGLVPAKPMARNYFLLYLDNASFFQDFRTLLNRGEIDYTLNLWIPNPLPFGPPLAYLVQAVAYFDPDSPPDDAFLLRDLTPLVALPTQDQSYLDFVLTVDGQIDFLRANVGWDGLIKPWLDVWLPDATVEQYVGSVIPTLTPADVGPYGFVLLIPKQRSLLTRPFFRLPDPAGGEWVYLFDILTASAVPGPNPAFVSQMLARNPCSSRRATRAAPATRSARSRSARPTGSASMATSGRSSRRASSASIPTTSSRPGRAFSPSRHRRTNQP